jgi:hypothetical protein
MTNRLPMKIFLSALLTMTLPTGANAADPGFCRQYAKAALNQVRGGLSNPASLSEKALLIAFHLAD